MTPDLELITFCLHAHLKKNNALERNKEQMERVFVTVRSITIIQGIYNVSE